MVDWNNLTVTDTELPPQARTGKDNPLRSHVEAAAKDGRAKLLPPLSQEKGEIIRDADGNPKKHKDGSEKRVPSEAEEAEKMLRRAVDEMKKGLRIRKQTDKDGKLQIRFEVTERRTKAPNSKTEDKSADKTADKTASPSGASPGATPAPSQAKPAGAVPGKK